MLTDEGEGLISKDCVVFDKRRELLGIFNFRSAKHVHFLTVTFSTFAKDLLKDISNLETNKFVMNFKSKFQICSGNLPEYQLDQRGSTTH